MTIRPAKTGDLILIRELAHLIWPDAYGEILSQAQVNYMLDKMYAVQALEDSVAGGHQFLIVESDGKPIGFAGYEHNYKSLSVTRIHKIYVLPQTQGQGVGKMLIGHIASLALAKGSNALSLNVNRSNKARGFYQKLGFEIVEELDIPIGNGYLMEDYRMEKKL